MAQIDLHIGKSMFSPKFFPILFDYSHRWEVYMGSAGSGKSFFITQKLIIKALNEPRRILVCRKYGSTIRQTVFNLFKDVLAQFKIKQFVKINEGDYRIKFPNGSEIIFTGLDMETKLLSLSDISDIFVEEMFECSEDIVQQLNLRMRGTAPNQQIFCAYNPLSKNSWIYKFVEVNPPDSFIRLHSTYRDNPFLSAQYIKTLEDLYRTNPAKARVFCDGKYGLDPEGLVFKNWQVQDFDVMALSQKGLEHRCGADIGWVDKTAISETLYDADNKTIYIVGEFYKSGVQLDEMVNAIYDMHINKCKIYFDSAEPRTIDFMRRSHINAVPCIKGRDSVKARIMFLQNHKIIIHPKCVNAIMEFQNFSYIKSKQTGEYTEDTTHEFSHFCCDATGYAYSDIYTRGRLTTMSKSVLGL